LPSKLIKYVYLIIKIRIINYISISIYLLLYIYSSINEVLDKEGVTLEDVLGEDELLQEIKAKNDRLIEL